MTAPKRESVKKQQQQQKPQVVDRAVELLCSFNPIRQTVSAFADDNLHWREGDEHAPSDAVFLRQVLYGCVRCKEPLKIFLAHMFSDLAASIERADYTLYMVLGYLLLFRLDELGFDKFRAITHHEDPLKICALLQYVTDRKRMQGPITQDWLTVFDLKYINDVMLGALERSSDAIAEHCALLQVKTYGKQRRRSTSTDATAEALRSVPARPATIAQPFNLTRPNPRRVPEPMKIEAVFKTGPDPRYLDRAKDLQAIAEENAERLAQTKAATAKKYEEAEAQGLGEFKLHETRNTVDAKRKEIEAQRAAELQFSRRPAKPPPQFSDTAAEVRLNLGAILREDALLKKKQAEDASLIKAYESELRDSTEYIRWQTSMREKDAQLKLEQTERKRQQAKASQAAARAALIGQDAANHELAQCIKAEKAVMAQQRRAEEELKLMINKQVVKQVTEVRGTAPKEAVARTLQQRRQAKEHLTAQLEEGRRRRQWEASAEFKEVQERVLRLRQDEVHSVRVKVFNPTESSGLMLLNEMSLAETRERLAMNKMRERQEEAERRRQILADKAAKQADLQKAIASISEAREAAAAAKAAARAKASAAAEAAEQRQKLPLQAKSAELLETLEAKRDRRQAELQSLEQQEAERQKAALYLGAAAAGSSARAMQDLLKGAERAERNRQALAAAEAQAAGM
ncbi:hypothetical protein JKP88DRAFT_156539 [Tribonema minus]|uniref:Uncharacterized protein n=1 Tax=Tribonema minus TaxID=303371 RepID=A0A835ZFS9_9STRA|nr:hypothetical protein JKP88DRAFT_156539 [Tribonema minus]